MQEELLIRIFFEIDEFCKEYNKFINKNILTCESEKILNNYRMSLSEIITINIYFHHSNYRTFKYFYKNQILGELKKYFTKSVSYNRFLELKKLSILPMLFYSIIYKKSVCTGISFIDSTPLSVCNNRRIYSNNVFKGFVEIEKNSTGFFYGFKKA